MNESYIGKTSTRPDAGDKASGRAAYIHDLSRPGMLIGKVKFSEHAHARIVKIDTSRAERLPGVRAVITAANTPELRIGFLRDNVALKGDRVRQFRDEVAAVAAIDADVAAEAVELIRVEYEALPAVFSPEEALAEGAPLVHETDARGRPRTDNRLDLVFRHASGDLTAGQAQSAHVAEGSFSTALIQQSCMGTAGCIAEFDANNDLTIWAKTQIPFLAQRDFNKALAAMGLAGHNTRVIVPAIGGAFGTGLDTHAYEHIAILLAHRTGRPIKIVYTRDEEFACLSPRQSCTVDIAQGCDENGKLTFRKIHVLQDNGAYTSWGATYPTVMLLPATSLYPVPNIGFDATLVYTNNTYAQAMRGYGNPELAWALENNIDQLAEAAGLDPLEFRLINCNRPGEVSPMGLKVTTCGLRECIEGVAEKLSWKDERGQGASLHRGVGMASLFHVGGGGRIYRSDACGIQFKLDDFANLDVFCGAVEMGQGLHTVLTAATAEAVGLRPEQVRINPTDTGTCPWDVGTHASRGAFMACKAAIRAAEVLRQKIFDLAAELFCTEAHKQLKKLRRKNPGLEVCDFDLESVCSPDSFQLRDGQITVQGAPDEGWLKLDLSSLLRAAHFRPQGTILTAEAFYDPPNELPDWERGWGNMSATYAWGAQGAQVEVDTETGEVHLLKMAMVHDVGRVLNPQTLRGQMLGALAQGVGYALYEQVLSQDGRILNPNFRDYKIPTICEMDFPVDLDFVETDDPEGPFGAKGVGEPGLVPTAPAISNAIYDAVGVRIHDLPITPEKVLAALAERDRTKSQRSL